MAQGFARRVRDWAARHGRHDLPWQRPATAYRVWVSEIMLQQTQVATVIPYFERFLARFPDVESLAAAREDEVLALWSGLGYYARARNLHRTAAILAAEQGGDFPAGLAAVQALPGIGRSTAGAILSLARGEPHPVLDGNVKRVLARYHGIDGWPGERAVAARLWQLAADALPARGAGAYNQAMMDLGATLCTRTRPRCEACPLARDCRARAAGAPERYPGRRPRRALPERSAWLLLLRDPEQGLLLERRAGAGRWGGLWSFPEFDAREPALDWAAASFGELANAVPLAPFRHSFTHFHLDLQPLAVELARPYRGVMDHTAQVWYNGGQPPGGFPRPVTNLLTTLEILCPTSSTA